MEHDAHLSDEADQAGPGIKVIALIVVLAALLAIGAYVIYGLS